MIRHKARNGSRRDSASFDISLCTYIKAKSVRAYLPSMFDYGDEPREVKSPSTFSFLTKAMTTTRHPSQLVAPHLAPISSLLSYPSYVQPHHDRCTFLCLVIATRQMLMSSLSSIRQLPHISHPKCSELTSLNQHISIIKMKS